MSAIFSPRNATFKDAVCAKFVERLSSIPSLLQNIANALDAIEKQYKSDLQQPPISTSRLMLYF